MTSAARRNGAYTQKIGDRKPRTGPIGVVVPFTGHPATRTVALAVEAAVDAGAGNRLIFTTFVNGTPQHLDHMHPWGLHHPHRTLHVHSPAWNVQIARGLRHTLDLGAHAVVIADPTVPADQQPLTTALSMLDEKVGVVCSPLRRPWWHQLLAMHVLRPLLGASLGLTPLDPCSRTLVLSAPAADNAATHLEKQPWAIQAGTAQYPHGLDILTIAYTAKATIAETLPRTPAPAALPDRPLVDWIECRTLIPATLRLCGSPGPRPTNAVPASADDADLDCAPPPQAVADAAGDITRLLTTTQHHGRTTAWPEPLQEAWDAARIGVPYADTDLLENQSHRLSHAYLERLRTSLPHLGYGSRARAHEHDASVQFLRHTKTPVTLPTLPRPSGEW